MGVPSTRSTIVVDASLAVWAIVPVVASVDAIGLFAGWRRQGPRLVAPALWLAECASAVRRSAYAGALSEEEGRAALEDLFALEVETLPLTLQQARSAFEWAERLRQAQAYYGFYLALAEELAAELGPAIDGWRTGHSRRGPGGFMRCEASLETSQPALAA